MLTCLLYSDGCLMPESEAMLTTINANSGHGRITRNWVMGRLLRDFNNTLDKEMKHELSHIPSDSHGHLSADREGSRVRQESKHFEGLRVTVFEVDNTPPAAHGVPTPDWVWYSGFAVIICQLLIASLPWGMSGQWDTFLVTAAGVFLALVSGSLPQWRREKWACPHKGSDTTIITEGNGSRSAIVILGKKGVGLHLEVLARGTRTAQPTLLTSVATSILAVLWILILLTVAGMKQNAWCKSP